MQLSHSVPLFIAFGLASAANRCETNGWYNGPFGNNRQLNAPNDAGASASYAWNGNTIVVKMQTKSDRCPPEDTCQDNITYNFKNTGTARIRVRIEEQVNEHTELILPPGRNSPFRHYNNNNKQTPPTDQPCLKLDHRLKSKPRRRRLEEEALIPVGEVDLGVDEEIEGVVNEAVEAANQNQDRVSVAPEPAAPPAAPANASEAAPSGSSRRGRGRGGSRGGRRGGATRGGQVSGTQRTFGGHLTTNVTGGESSASLSADAPDFVPGQPIAQKSAPAPKQRKPQYPTAPKSTANDLPTRIHEDISHGQTHTCRKECHRPGECEDADIAGHHCAQSCGKIRKSCEHSCQDVCHAPYPCKEDRPCQSKTFITCDCQHRKKEVKCLATLANPTPERDTLKCDDECLRLQRNQRLAAALNVDPDHSDDHIPYSDKTLQLFRGVSPTWAQNQEREFRVFASEPSEKRLRFKPMPSKQRAFLHSLAEDFGFDSESQDPEPHRHVSIFKTPRFVSAPKKTIAQCVKIRTDAAKAAAPPAPSSSAAATAVPDPFNSILLTAPRFGLTIDEVDSALAPHLTAHNNLSFTTSFLPSDEILLRAVPVTSWGTSPSAVESSLTSLRTLVHRTVTKEGFAAAAILVTSDANLNVLRREGATAGGSGGWNAVVGRAAAQRRTLAPAKPEARPASGFVSFSKLARKKIVEDSVADDWEAAADGEE
ncbi:FKBP12-associated protein 1-like protein [Colletotrichum spinosum]|uniref:FKBP12-associated protein 1-like protein n=1 Tax=Colletotrichum spinosum TaxID=1347390 RepID=A0A4R8PSA6_9PEZI|nr:FKBP12-associated protein 1-like protein [Colletotrichum spinosum]